ncbi:hypothetical protein GN956_G2260 [Arapaima gigas]
MTSEMAGKLKTEELSSILERLANINSVLDSNAAALLRSQEQLSKTTETQMYLNKSLKPLLETFVPHEDPISSLPTLK